MTTISDSHAQAIREELAALQAQPNRGQAENDVLALAPLFLEGKQDDKTIERWRELVKNRDLTDPAWGIVHSIDALFLMQ